MQFIEEQRITYPDLESRYQVLGDLHANKCVSLPPMSSFRPRRSLARVQLARRPFPNHPPSPAGSGTN